jgi:hypothetical protein
VTVVKKKKKKSPNVCGVTDPYMKKVCWLSRNSGTYKEWFTGSRYKNKNMSREQKTFYETQLEAATGESIADAIRESSASAQRLSTIEIKRQETAGTETRSYLKSRKSPNNMFADDRKRLPGTDVGRDMFEHQGHV